MISPASRLAANMVRNFWKPQSPRLRSALPVSDLSSTKPGIARRQVMERNEALPDPWLRVQTPTVSKRLPETIRKGLAIISSQTVKDRRLLTTPVSTQDHQILVPVLRLLIQSITTWPKMSLSSRARMAILEVTRTTTLPRDEALGLLRNGVMEKRASQQRRLGKREEQESAGLDRMTWSQSPSLKRQAQSEAPLQRGVL